MTCRPLPFLSMLACLNALCPAHAADQADTTWRTGWRIEATSLGKVIPDNDESTSSLGIKLDNPRWQATDPVAWTSNTPLGQINRSSIDFRLSYQDKNSWRYSFSPSLYRSQQQGSNRDNAWDFGASIDTSTQVSADLRLGLGTGVYRQLDQTRILPYVLVDWKINEQWRLANPDWTSPIGPAGLELGYHPFQRWQFAAGGAWKTDRFRLSRNNLQAPNGIVTSSGIPLYLRVGYSSQPGWKIDLYAIGLLSGKLNVEDENGNALSPYRFNIDPTIGINFTGQF